jgi:hypothetical protein
MPDSDSIAFYLNQARELRGKLPYNNGMVDVNRLSGICKTGIGAMLLRQALKDFC